MADGGAPERILGEGDAGSGDAQRDFAMRKATGAALRRNAATDRAAHMAEKFGDHVEAVAPAHHDRRPGFGAVAAAGSARATGAVTGKRGLRAHGGTRTKTERHVVIPHARSRSRARNAPTHLACRPHSPRTEMLNDIYEAEGGSLKGEEEEEAGEAEEAGVETRILNADGEPVSAAELAGPPAELRPGEPLRIGQLPPHA